VPGVTSRRAGVVPTCLDIALAYGERWRWRVNDAVCRRWATLLIATATDKRACCLRAVNDTALLGGAGWQQATWRDVSGAE